MSQSHPGPGGPTQASQLAELVRCEQELADLLAEARVQAERMVAEARAAAAAAAADLEASLEDEAQRLRSTIREATQLSVRELQADAEHRASSFGGVSAADVQRLAGSAFRRLIGAEADA